jgi:tRNA/rRNA methyltransferase
MEIAVVLVRPREEGNVGAAARAMANMGLGRLILVEPAAEVGGVARAFAVGARGILEGAVRVGSLREALAPFRWVVGTTSTRDRRQAVPLIEARELAARLEAEAGAGPVALTFGPEVGGLTNEELALANVVVTVPCALEQPTLNLAQAVLVLAYELYQARLRPAPEEVRERAVQTAMPQTSLQGTAAATAAEIDGLFDHVAVVLRQIHFERDSSFPGVLRDLRAAAARASLRSREVAVLRGICRRALHALDGKQRK